jgi:hypothetical protein
MADLRQRVSAVHLTCRFTAGALTHGSLCSSRHICNGTKQGEYGPRLLLILEAVPCPIAWMGLVTLAAIALPAYAIHAIVEIFTHRWG